MRDHGGNLDDAVATFGGDAADWLDLSTGINPVPYPVPTLPGSAWCALPTQAQIAHLSQAARSAYQTTADVVPLAGAQSAIQLVPRLFASGRAAVLGPTYNEHAAALRASGWQVFEVGAFNELAGYDLAVVVNPNNPTGEVFGRGALIDLASKVAHLVVDESFADADPSCALTPYLGAGLENVIVQRSFGKFFGLAGLRLGFVVCHADMACRVRAMAGPWAVSGPAIDVGIAALNDSDWQSKTRAHLAQSASKLDRLAQNMGWDLVGGTTLFRTFRTPSAERAQQALATARIWTRRFPYSDTWLRLGLPGSPDAWARVEEALARAAK